MPDFLCPICKSDIDYEGDLYRCPNCGISIKNINDLINKEPITEEPITEEPITEEPITEEPITEEPIREEPIRE